MLLGYSLQLLCCCGIFVLGSFMRHRTDLAERMFFWAPRFAAGYSRWVGMFFMVMSILGALMALTGIVLHLI